MGNIRYQRTAHRITSAVNCRPLKPSPRSICPAAPYPTGVHIPGIPPPAKFATEPSVACRWDVRCNGSKGMAFLSGTAPVASSSAGAPRLTGGNRPELDIPLVGYSALQRSDRFAFIGRPCPPPPETPASLSPPFAEGFIFSQLICG